MSCNDPDQHNKCGVHVGDHGAWHATSRGEHSINPRRADMSVYCIYNEEATLIMLSAVAFTAEAPPGGWTTHLTPAAAAPHWAGATVAVT